jgi:hypothetical protein
MEEIPQICPPVWSPEEQDADRRFEDTMKMRLRRCAASGSSQGLLDDETAEAVDVKRTRSRLLSVHNRFLH